MLSDGNSVTGGIRDVNAPMTADGLLRRIFFNVLKTFRLKD